jgi:hypothetical protein
MGRGILEVTILFYAGSLLASIYGNSTGQLLVKWPASLSSNAVGARLSNRMDIEKIPSKIESLCIQGNLGKDQLLQWYNKR